jgi:hypothetical protein
MYAVMVKMSPDHIWASFVYTDNGEDVFVSPDYEIALRYAQQMTYENLCPYMVVECVLVTTTEVKYG